MRTSQFRAGRLPPCGAQNGREDRVPAGLHSWQGERPVRGKATTF